MHYIIISTSFIFLNLDAVERKTFISNLEVEHDIWFAGIGQHESIL